jgi:hypothetical protein
MFQIESEHNVFKEDFTKPVVMIELRGQIMGQSNVKQIARYDVSTSPFTSMSDHEIVGHGQCKNGSWKINRIGSALVMLLLVLANLSHLPAQSASASLTGQVLDITGAVIPGADLVITNADTGLTSKGQTSGTGVYLITALPPGHYVLACNKAGFQKVLFKGITLTVGQAGTLNVTLNVGSTGDTVTVTGDAELVNTTTAEIGSIVSRESVSELPLNGRDPSSLVLLTTGVSDVLAATASGAGWKNGVTMPTETGASAGGGRQGSTYYLLDGAPNMDTYQELAAPFPNADATQEFRAVTNNFDARYGFSPAAVVSVETKSGANDFHGGAFEFVRNNDLNASDYFSHEVDLLKRNQFGAYLGGPIKKDKAFFFANYQATKGSVQSSGNAVYPIDQRMLNGDFSEIATQLPVSLGFDSSNQIDPSKFDSAALKLLKAAYPIGTSISTPLEYSKAPYHYLYNEGTGRLDYNISEAQRIMLRSFIQYSNQPSATINGDALSTVVGNDGKYINETVGHTWTINPFMVNTFNLFWNEMNVITLAKSKDTDGNDVCLSKYINVSEESGVCDFLGIEITGSYSPIWGMTYSDLRNTYGLNETFNYVHGNHSIVVGTTIQHQRMQDFVDFPVAPLVEFWGDYTGSAYADYLLGMASMYYQGGGEAAKVSGMQYGFYGQDQYKLRPNLTLTLGVRWDPNTPPQVPNGRGSAYRPGEKSTIYVNAPEGLLFVGDKGVNAGLMPTTLNFFEPRIGLAYQPKALPHTSMRAGFGLFTGPLQYSYYSHAASMSPWSPIYQFIGTVSFADPWGYEGMSDPFPPFDTSLSYKPASTYQFIGTTAVEMSFSSNFRPSTTQSWNLSVDQQISNDLALHLSYVGNEVYHLAVLEDMNPGGNGKTVGTWDVRPNSAYGTILQDQSTGTSSYNSLQAGIDKHYSHNLQFSSNFTFAKTIDTTTNANPSNDGGIGNPYDLRWSRGVSDLSVPKMWVSNFIYSTPILARQSDLVKNVLGSWQISGIWTMRSGIPFGIQGGNGDNNSGSLESGDRADVVPGQLWKQHSGSKNNWLNEYFNTAAFTENAVGTYGNSGRNIMNGPKMTSADAAIMKNWQLKERYHLQFRWEMFNAFNHASYENPGTDPSAPTTYGKITETGSIPARVMQGGIKLSF